MSKHPPLGYKLLSFQNRNQNFLMNTHLFIKILFYLSICLAAGSGMNIYPAIGCISLCKTHDLHILRGHLAFSLSLLTLKGKNTETLHELLFL